MDFNLRKKKQKQKQKKKQLQYYLWLSWTKRPYKFEFDLCDVDEIKEVPLSVFLTRYFGGYLFLRPPRSATKDCLEQMGPINSCGSGITCFC